MTAYQSKQINEFSQELSALENTETVVIIYVSGLANPIQMSQVIDESTYIKQLKNTFKDKIFKPSNGNYIYLRAKDKKLYKLKFDTIIGFSIFSINGWVH